ncbi:hypothetical protein BC628DRAFT_1367310 [Trametes gibbosa]|nr:hypothetical protein BC628DRAFT_1367310 [Trametes gibbosa]
MYVRGDVYGGEEAHSCILTDGIRTDGPTTTCARTQQRTVPWSRVFQTVPRPARSHPQRPPVLVSVMESGRCSAPPTPRRVRGTLGHSIHRKDTAAPPSRTRSMTAIPTPINLPITSARECKQITVHDMIQPLFDIASSLNNRRSSIEKI